jgi:hypothetical protein
MSDETKLQNSTPRRLEIRKRVEPIFVLGIITTFSISLLLAAAQAAPPANKETARMVGLRGLSEEELASLGLRSTGIPGIFRHVRPPANFDPVGASDVELARYGFPSRPPDTHSVRYRQWKTTFSRPLRFADRPLSTGDKNRLRSIHPRPRPIMQTYTFNPNWSGMLNGNPTGTVFNNGVPNGPVAFGSPSAITDIRAIMTCPNVDGSNPNRVTNVAEWIGIDGYDNLGVNDGLIQAGISVESPGPLTGGFSYGPFSTVISSNSSESTGGVMDMHPPITVNPGDAVLVDITPMFDFSFPFGGGSEAAQSYFFLDLTTGDADSYVMDQSTPLIINYALADWIVEDPGGQIFGTGTPSTVSMAHYGNLFMWDAYATLTSPAGSFIYPGTGTLTPLYFTDSNGNVISTVSVLGKDTLMFFQP